MSWTKRVQHPSEVVKKGDSVDVVILNIDSENKRISLGLKQAEEDPWLRIGETYPVGTELTGTVVRLMDKGVVVDIGNDIEGFVPLSQLSSRASRSTARRTSSTRRCVSTCASSRSIRFTVASCSA
jgi:small subunit ribosomal protein S1